MSIKLAISSSFIIILLAITVYIASCINYVAKNYKCNISNSTHQNLNITDDSVTVIMWVYIVFEIIIFLCIGIMIGLNVSNNTNVRIPIALVVFLNIAKLIVFIISIAMYSGCILELSVEKIYLLIFFCINVITVGISENIVTCSLLREKTKRIVYNSSDEEDVSTVSIKNKEKRANPAAKRLCVERKSEPVHRRNDSDSSDQESFLPNANTETSELNATLLNMPNTDRSAAKHS